MVRNTPEVKQLNTEMIRAEIQKRDKCTKAEISRSTGLSVATCSTILNAMSKSGEIIQVEQESPNVGRPASVYSYNADYQHVLGMYITTECGVETIAYVVADGLGRIRKTEELQLEEITYSEIERLVRLAIEEDPLIQRMTFGIPGISHRGMIEVCDIASVVGVNVEGQLSERFGIPVETRNDMDFIVSGVYANVSHRGGTLVAMYFPRTEDGWVGCGIVIRGKVLRGNSKFAGEVSYIPAIFGISREEQTDIILRQERGAFRRLVARLVMTIICTLDPEVIMLMGNDIAQEDLDVIHEECGKIVSERHIPRILADNDVDKNYMAGLVRAALDSLQFPISR